MFSSLFRNVAVAALAMGATVAQADPFFNPAATVTGTLTWNWFSDGSKTVYVTGYGPNGSAGPIPGIFRPERLVHRRFLSLFLHGTDAVSDHCQCGIYAIPGS